MAAYAARLASFDWQPLTAYDKAAAPVVLVRSGDQACVGSWAAATIFPEHFDDPSATWRSLEEATLEMPLQFEPERFAVLDAETLHGFNAT